MALEKQEVIDLISVKEHGLIEWRVATRIVDDGVFLSQSYWRSTLSPGQDLSNIPDAVKDICEVVWTPQVIADWEARLAAEPGGGG
jgi:hypothetical protein